MFTSSSDHRSLYHHITPLISTQMRMHRRNSQWVSHRNHRGNICGMRFLWLLNPNKYRKLLKGSWSWDVQVSTENDAFAFLKADNAADYISYSGFCETLQQLNLTVHHHGLSDEETKDLWVQVDIDGNGILDYKEFQALQLRIWKLTWTDPRDEFSNEDQIVVVTGSQEQTTGFSVKNAVLFPPEVEKGMWPENYSLSDHAYLTVVFSPIRMPCSSLS